MQTFIQGVEAVAVLLGIGVLGFWLLSRRVLPQEALQFLSTLALEVALPCLVFAQITGQFQPSDYPEWWLMPVSWLALTAGLAAFTFAAMWISQVKTRREFGMTLFYQNATFVPLVILTEMSGAGSPIVLRLFFFVMFFGAFVFATYGLFFRQSWRKLKPGKILHPVLVMTLAAVLLSLAGMQSYVPDFVLRALQMVGQMTVPLLMLILGGSIYLDLQQRGDLQFIEVAKFVALKNVILPVLTLAVLTWIRPPADICFIVFLESAMPPITAAPVLAKRVGGNGAIVSQFLVGSFAFSLLTIPAGLALFELVLPFP